MMFSIVIPVFNVAPYLRPCLESVLAQTNGSWEAVCVDDGSTDGSGAILDEYAARDGRFHVIHQSNGGVAAARNAALDACSGDWVAFLDADDVLSPCAVALLQGVVEMRKEDVPDVLAFKAKLFKEDVSVSFPVLLTSGALRVVNSERTLDCSNASCFFSTKLYRRDVIGATRFRSYTVGEDLLFMLEVMLKSNCTVEIDAVLYGYRMRLGSAIHSAMNLHKLKDELGCNLNELQVIRTAKKKIEASFRRRIINWVLEDALKDVILLPKKSRREGFELWRHALKEMNGICPQSGFQGLRLKVFELAPLFTVAKLLFAFPRWLKAHGVHR